MKEWPIILEKLWYDGNGAYSREVELESTYEMDEVMIIYANFKTKNSTLDSGFNPNSNYPNFTLIFARNIGSDWILKDSGY